MFKYNDNLYKLHRKLWSITNYANNKAKSIKLLEGLSAFCVSLVGYFASFAFT